MDHHNYIRLPVRGEAANLSKYRETRWYSAAFSCECYAGWLEAMVLAVAVQCPLCGRQCCLSPFRAVTLSADITPPVLSCPFDISVKTDINENTASVTWQAAVGIDNSGFMPHIDVIPALVPPAALPIGSTTITYIAEDISKNKAKCSFTITVKGRCLR